MSSQTTSEKMLEHDFISSTTNRVPFLPQREVSVFSIATKLQEQAFSITTVDEIAYGTQIRLACGAIINVFDNGTVFVQGKMDKHTRTRTMELLKKALPENTRWGL